MYIWTYFTEKEQHKKYFPRPFIRMVELDCTFFLFPVRTNEGILVTLLTLLTSRVMPVVYRADKLPYRLFASALFITINLIDRSLPGSSLRYNGYLQSKRLIVRLFTEWVWCVGLGCQFMNLTFTYQRNWYKPW